MSFARAMAFVYDWEGGFSDHPSDPGGATNLGITQKTLDDFRQKFPDWGLPGDVRVLTKPHASRIYVKGYWEPVRGDELPSGIDLLVFDCAVNQGTGRAIRMLQQAAGVAIDGDFGPITLAAVRQATRHTLMREFATLRALAYVRTGNMATFGLGWMRRLMACVIEAAK
jgi:lysozyme family protein